MRQFSTAITITDPLVKYQSLLTAGVYSPDPAQHRLARHLRKVYLRIKDYSPHHEYRQRLSRIRRLVEATEPPRAGAGAENILAVPTHAIWRNPLFRHLLPAIIAGAGGSGETRDSLALTRVLQDHELAIQIDSPRGLFLSGDVGTGKSMLLDLLADGLPHTRKRRWHFNTFMLHTFTQLDRHRAAAATATTTAAPYSLSGSSSSDSDSAREDMQQQHSLLWMARNMVDESPILFLDEFQLPDRAASRIICHLFVAFFQLGGVLIASSNRVPEDLEKAAGVDYASAPRLGIMRKLFGGAARARGSELYGQSSDFSKLLDVLKARCDFWQMDGVQDWRRREDTGTKSHTVAVADKAGGEAVATNETSLSGKQDVKIKTASSPQNYFIAGQDDDSWPERVRETAFGRDMTSEWESRTIVVYGRRVIIPQHHNGIVLWDFSQLVGSFGPADYITMASSFHTFIVDGVPAMTILQKNEARRFITFLDAAYEARCKLLIRAENPPDDLFFPQTSTSASASASASASSKPDDGSDATYSETIAEVYQDQTSPFRPNVSLYDTERATSRYDPDQDSDFKLEEDDRCGASGAGQGRLQQQVRGATSGSGGGGGGGGGGVDFGDRTRFTGEDERFAYKRAASRLWELCSARWHARTGAWWRPLPVEARHWEGGAAAAARSSARQSGGGGIGPRGADAVGEGVGESVAADEVAGLSRYRIEQLKQREG